MIYHLIFQYFFIGVFYSLVMTQNPVYISPAKRGWIRRKIKTGKTKFQIAKELHVTSATIYNWTKDIPSTHCGWPGIRGKTLDILQKLLTKGYCFSSHDNFQCRFITLKKYFPTIHRINVYKKNILYFEGKESEAAQAFINHLHCKRIISLQELKQITKVFGTELSRS